MTNESLILAYGLVIAALWISAANHLRMEKEVVVASLRATVQLLAMGFILEALFRIEQPGYLFLVLLFMCAVAGMVSGNRGRGIPHSHAIALAGILSGSLVTFAILYFAGVIQPEAKFAIPLGGMIIGNSMKASSLALNRLIGELGHQRQRIETLLALGANARQATLDAVRQSVKTAMMPTIDTMKTVGLVHLPGLMTGYLIAGGAPLTAVKYQLVVMFMVLGTTGITCLIVTLLAYRQCFTADLRLIPINVPLLGRE